MNTNQRQPELSHSTSHAALIGELRLFGLNPSDWTFKEIQDCGRRLKVKLVHRMSEVFQIEGEIGVEVKKGRPMMKWHHLAVLA